MRRPYQVLGGNPAEAASAAQATADAAAALAESRAPTSVVVNRDQPASYNSFTSFADAFAAVAKGASLLARIGVMELDVVVIATHDGGDSSASLSDSTQAWGVDELVGRFVWNQSDGSWGKITANTATTVTVAMVGGDTRLFDDGDSCVITSSAEVPAGAWDLTGIELHSLTPLLGAFDFQQGASLTALPALVGEGVHLRNSGNAALHTCSNPFGDTLRLAYQSNLVGSHLAPVVTVPNGFQLIVHALPGSVIGLGSGNFNPALHVAGGGDLRIFLWGNAQIKSNALSGDSGNDCKIYRMHAQAQLDPTQNFAAGAPEDNDLTGISTTPPTSKESSGTGPIFVDDSNTDLTSLTAPEDGAYWVTFCASITGLANGTAIFELQRGGSTESVQIERQVVSGQPGSVSVQCHTIAGLGETIKAVGVCSNATGFNVNGHCLVVTRITSAV